MFNQDTGRLHGVWSAQHKASCLQTAAAAAAAPAAAESWSKLLAQTSPLATVLRKGTEQCSCAAGNPATCVRPAHDIGSLPTCSVPHMSPPTCPTSWWLRRACNPATNLQNTPSPHRNHAALVLDRRRTQTRPTNWWSSSGSACCRPWRQPPCRLSCSGRAPRRACLKRLRPQT